MPRQANSTFQGRSYEEARAHYETRSRLQGHGNEVKIAHNTWLTKAWQVNPEWTRSLETPYYTIRLYLTHILTYDINTRVRINTGGMRTHLTRDRLRMFLPRRLALVVRHGQWVVDLSPGSDLGAGLNTLPLIDGQWY